MKQTEVIKLIGLCSVNYKGFPEKDKEEMLITLWTRMLSDVDFYVATIAVEKYLAESAYPPTIADIRARIADIMTIQPKTAIEAWGEACQAIRKYGSYNEKDALDSLKGVTRKVVESMGYRNLCLSENDMADRAHFLKVYDTLAQRERQDAVLLEGTKTAMRRLQGEQRLLNTGQDESA